MLALDWRGHGDTEWVGAGGYYHFPDYAADLAGVVRALGGTGRARRPLDGRGRRRRSTPARRRRASRALACIDALGPPDMDPNDVPRRYASWLADLDKSAARARPVLTLADATAALRERFPHFPERSRPSTWRCTARGRDERRPRAGSSIRSTRRRRRRRTTCAQARPFWQRIACPVLYVAGAKSPFRLDAADEADRLAALRAERVELPDVGHHPHLEAPERLADLLDRRS